MVSRLSEQQVEVISEAKAFARDHFVDGESFDRTETFPEQIWRDAGEAGLLGTFIPKAYGGRDLGFLTHTLVMEEFWRIDPGLGNVLLSVFGAELLMKFGSEEQKQGWLPSLAAGKAIPREGGAMSFQVRVRGGGTGSARWNSTAPPDGETIRPTSAAPTPSSCAPSSAPWPRPSASPTSS